MKRTTAIMTTLALMLAMVSCNNGTTKPEVTTAGTTVGQGLAPAVTETAAQTTVMTTVETSVETITTEMTEFNITSMLEGYELYKMSSEELEDFRNGFPEDSALGKIAVEVTDYDGLYLLIEDNGVTEDNDGGYYRAEVRRVICGDTVQDCEIPFVFGPEGFGLLKTDEYTVVSRCWYDSYHYIFHKDGCAYIPVGFGRNGGSPSLYVEDDVLKYRTKNPKYARMQSVYQMFDILEDEHEWDYEWGTVTINDGKAIMTRIQESLLSERDYLHSTFEEIKGKKYEFNGKTYDFTEFETLDELLEYNKTKNKKE